MNESIRQALADAGGVDIDAPNEVIGAAVLSTPTPAQLAVGDRVVVNRGPWDNVPGTVLRVYTSGGYSVQLDGALWTFRFWPRDFVGGEASR